MPRTARIDIPRQLYHVTARGVERRDLFHDDMDRQAFLARFSTLMTETETQCLAWAIMSNHIHLLLRPGPQGLAAFMRRLLTGHAVAFNRRHRRVGHLFQNRFHSLLCEEDTYLLPLIRYIHLNPIHAGMVSDLAGLDRYPWCGHVVLMGNATLTGQQVDEVLGYFGQREKPARRSYRDFLADGVENGQVSAASGFGKGDLIQSLSIENGSDCGDGRILGSHDFAERFLPGESPSPSESLSFQELIQRVAQEFSVTVDDLRGRSRTRDLSDARALICHLAISHLKMSGAEVAHHLGQVRSSVTRAKRRGEELGKGRHDWLTMFLRT
jgi:putative transposase